MNEGSLLTQEDESHSDLPLISETGQLYQWIYQMIRPYMKGKILEIGSKNGDISELFVSDRLALRISDPDNLNCQALQKRFAEEPMIKGVHQLDLADPAFEITYNKFLERFDTVLLMNTIKGSGIDEVILDNAKKLLRDRGRLISFLPARTALYGESNEGFDDWNQSNFIYIKNFLGEDTQILSFLFFIILVISPSVGDLPRQGRLPDPHSFDYQQIPFFKVGDESLGIRKGLSIITVARKV